MLLIICNPSSHRRAALAAGLALVFTTAQAQQHATPTDPRGRWITASGNLEVEIAPCGQALCGIVTQVLGSRSMSRNGEAMQPVDTRPALGMTLLKDFVPTTAAPAGGAPVQWHGAIYNRENGKTYQCLMSLDAAADGHTALVLHPYVGLPLFGKTQYWQRAVPATAAVSQN